MPVVNRVAALTEEISAWRRDLHQHPELQYEVHRTAASVAERLASFGVDQVVTGIGRTGVVGVIHGRRRGSGRVVAMRADMDALPIEEATGLPYASPTPGLMHACGHDGHTAMLLGAAKYLAETRNFDGTAVVIFQPAEEGGAGAKAMIDDGLMERFDIQEVYGMHNMPGLPLGAFATRPGPMMASADRVFIDIEGKGGHAAHPQATVDTVLVGAAIVQMLQSVVSRNLDPLDSRGGVDHHVPGRPHRQRHSPDRAPARHRPRAHRRGARPAGGPHLPYRRGDGADLRRQRPHRLSPRLSGGEEPRPRDRLCRGGGPRDRRRRQVSRPTPPR